MKYLLSRRWSRSLCPKSVLEPFAVVRSWHKQLMHSTSNFLIYVYWFHHWRLPSYPVARCIDQCLVPAKALIQRTKPMENQRNAYRWLWRRSAANVDANVVSQSEWHWLFALAFGHWAKLLRTPCHQSALCNFREIPKDLVHQPIPDLVLPALAQPSDS